jgi:hypothetical protein
MKNTKRIISLLLIIALAVSLSSCYVVFGQKMRTVKGTYKLTSYTYTPQHERREGYTAPTHDYVNGEKYMYEDYLVVTGTGSGYYVHKGADGDAYVKEITLSYEYDPEDSSKVNYVTFNDSISVNSDEGGRHRLGVSRNSFNYSKAAFDYTEIITKRKMRTESIGVHWEKVSRATDLSYVSEQLGELKYYDYQSFAKRGIYEVSPSELPEGTDYAFIVIDTAKDTHSITVYAEENGETTVKSVGVFDVAEGWSSFRTDSANWSSNAMSGGYTVEYGEITYSVSRVRSGITQSDIDELIAGRMAE